MLAQIVVTMAGAAALAGRTAVVLTGLVLAAGAARAFAGTATGASELLVGPPLLLLWIVPAGLACVAGLRRECLHTALGAEDPPRRPHGCRPMSPVVPTGLSRASNWQSTLPSSDDSRSRT